MGFVLNGIDSNEYEIKNKKERFPMNQTIHSSTIVKRSRRRQTCTSVSLEF